MLEEYSVEIYDVFDRWIRQVDLFDTFEKAAKYCSENLLKNNNRYSIWCIEYDKKGNEINAYPVY